MCTLTERIFSNITLHLNSLIKETSTVISLLEQEICRTRQNCLQDSIRSQEMDLQRERTNAEQWIRQRLETWRDICKQATYKQQPTQDETAVIFETARRYETIAHMQCKGRYTEGQDLL